MNKFFSLSYDIDKRAVVERTARSQNPQNPQIHLLFKWNEAKCEK